MGLTKRRVAPDPKTISCHEVWGGNNAVDQGVVMHGLDAWLFSCPYAGQTCGGDLHYVSTCAAGLMTRVLIADVTGHGEAVSGTSSALATLMRKYVNFFDHSKFVSEINTQFSEMAGASGVATAIAMTYAATEKLLVLSNAGHPPPLYYSAKKKRWSLLTSEHEAGEDGEMANVPLGIGSARYDQIEAKLSTEDIVVLYTDSLIEAEDLEGDQIGVAGLLEMVSELDPADAGEFMHEFLVAVAARTGDPSSRDDVTVLVLRANDVKTWRSPKVLIKSRVLMWWAIFEGLLPGGPPIPWPEYGKFARLARFLGRINPKWGMPD